VSDPTHPTLEDILDAFERLADRVAGSPASRLDPFVSVSLRRACEELRRYVPGLDAPPDAEAARFLARAAYAALEDGDSREALSRSLRGLAFAPHHPGLYYAASSACFEYGAVEDAVRLLRHTLWIHPGHAAARRDLAALNAYLRARWEQPGERTAEQGHALSEPAGYDPELAFDGMDDAADGPAGGPVDDDDGCRPDEGEDRAA
jgi:tetratricopeptide (TPR) repeat protein